MTEEAAEAMTGMTGRRVIEVSAFVAAPFAGMVLAQMGADVIRVDPIGGPPDQGRWPVAPDGTSYFWAGLNRGKRSLRLDTRSERGAEIFHALIDSDPVGSAFLTNVPMLGRFGGHEAVNSLHPKLVTLEMTGNADGTSEVDYTVQPATGIPFITGHRSEGAPLNSPLPSWDLMLGLYAVLAITDAVAQRAITGQGRFLSLALSDIAFSTVATLGRLGAAQAGLPVEERAGNDLQGGYGQAFRTASGSWVMVVALTDRQWRALISTVDEGGQVRAALDAAGADVSNPIERYLNRRLITALFQPWFADRSLEEVRLALDSARASWSMHRTFSGVLDDPRLSPELNDLWSDVEHPTLGVQRMPGYPVRRDGRVTSIARRSPLPGEHSAEILQNVLGLDCTEIVTLMKEGVVQ